MSSKSYGSLSLLVIVHEITYLGFSFFFFFFWDFQILNHRILLEDHQGLHLKALNLFKKTWNFSNFFRKTLTFRYDFSYLFYYYVLLILITDICDLNGLLFEDKAFWLKRAKRE